MIVETYSVQTNIPASLIARFRHYDMAFDVATPSEREAETRKREEAEKSFVRKEIQP